MLQGLANGGREGTGPEAGVALFDREGRLVFSDLCAVAATAKLRRAVLAYLSREASLLAGRVFVTAVQRSGTLRSSGRRYRASARFTDVSRLGSFADGGVLVVVDLDLVTRSSYDALALTPRERELAGLLVEGLGNREIAERLDLEEPTVKWHLSRLYKKARVRSRGAFVAAVLSKTSSRGPAAAEGAREP